ncbi:MAG: hypothetical protein R2795_17355 [Saprospiraceae bacterium]
MENIAEQPFLETDVVALFIELGEKGAVAFKVSSALGKCVGRALPSGLGLCLLAHCSGGSCILCGCVDSVVLGRELGVDKNRACWMPASSLLTKAPPPLVVMILLPLKLSLYAVMPRRAASLAVDMTAQCFRRHPPILEFHTPLRCAKSLPFWRAYRKVLQDNSLGALSFSCIMLDGSF